MPADITTARLTLVPATDAILAGSLAGPAALERVLGVTVPSSWPPELFDEGAMRWTRDWLKAHPDEAAWGTRIMVRRGTGGALAMAIGVCGFRGAPDAEGGVELGYGVLGEHRRQGYATEAVQGLVAWAFEDPRVRVVTAQTLQSLAPSIGVLVGNGFAYMGPGSDTDIPEGEVVVRYGRWRA